MSRVSSYSPSRLNSPRAAIITGSVALVGWLFSILAVVGALATDVSTQALLLVLAISASATLCSWNSAGRWTAQRRSAADARDILSRLAKLKADRVDYFSGFADGARLSTLLPLSEQPENVVPIPRRPINGYAHHD